MCMNAQGTPYRKACVCKLRADRSPDIIEKPAWRPACIHAAGGNASCPHGRVRDDQLHAAAGWSCATGTLHASDPLRDAVLKQNGETAPVRLPCGSSGELAPSIFPSPLTTEGRQIREASVSSLGQAFDPSRSFSCLPTAPFPQKPDLGQASLGVALARFPLPGRYFFASPSLLGDGSLTLCERRVVTASSSRRS